MDQTGNHVDTPDNWEQSEECGMGDAVEETSDKIAELKLNADAPAFIPGKNVWAREFVPCIPSSNSSPEKTNDKNDLPSEDNKLTPMDTGQNDVGTRPVEDAPNDWTQKAEVDGAPKQDEGGGEGEQTATAVEDVIDDEDEFPDEEEDVMDIPIIVKPKRRDPSLSEEKKTHVNIVFIGHVDAGKSTIGGHIMYLTGMVDKRTLEKYEKEAKEKNRESWYLSWALDTNQEERDKGKTVEVGRAYFETDSKHFTILDAPGHKSFVPNMIGGASQADVAVLVISARKGEFETGFERGGQTREHAMLVKTAGVKHLIVVVNKMDDPTVNWDVGRFNEIKDKLTPYLKKCGFNPKVDLHYIPVSGLTGAFLKDPAPHLCSWYGGLSLIQYLDSLPIAVERMSNGPVRLPIVDRYKDMGTIVLGKIESGTVKRGYQYMLMPNKMIVEVMTLFSDEDETESAFPGENVKVKLKNVEEEDVSPGFVLCSMDNVCHTGKVFDAQIVILEHKSIICAGYSAVMHMSCGAEEVTIKALICIIDKKTGEKSKTRPRFVKQDQLAIVRLEVMGGIICLEPFKDFPQMGRFTLRDEGKTIAIGKVLKVIA